MYSCRHEAQHNETELCVQALFTIMFSYPLFYQEFNIEVYKDYFTNTMANDTALIDGTYALMVPEPHGPEVQVMDTTQFFQIPMPKAYISLTQDFTLSSNYKSWLLFSDRVKKANNGGVPYQVSRGVHIVCISHFKVNASQNGTATFWGTNMMLHRAKLSALHSMHSTCHECREAEISVADRH